MAAEQFEAAILQNFLLVQADKHGHQLLAALPGIAGTVDKHGHQLIAGTTQVGEHFPKI